MQFSLVISFSLFVMSISQAQIPEHIVQQNLDAYNAHDIDTFMSFFSDDVVLQNFADQKITAEGVEAVRAIYEPYFEASPELYSKIEKRIVFGNRVIDHEYITGRYGSDEVLQLVLIYEVNEGKISKITVLREKE